MESIEKNRLQKLAGISSIPFTETTIDGYTFKTGAPITFPYRKITNKSSTPNVRDVYQQTIEPTGNYISFDLNQAIKGDNNNDVNYGEITFNNPLVLKFNAGEEEVYDSNNWKTILANHFGNKGRALSSDIINKGYDAIVTVYNDGDIAEIVDLTSFR